MTRNDQEFRDREFETLFTPLRAERVRFRPGFRAAVMRRIREAPRTPLRRAWEWLVTPSTIRLRPAVAGLALAAALLVAALVGPGRNATPAAPPAANGGVPVRFVLVAPQATQVAVTGDFANWDPEGVTMRRAGDGRWIAEVRLEPGVHQYVFVVDGTDWRPDPNAASQVDDGFGQQNSVVLVPEKRAS